MLQSCGQTGAAGSGGRIERIDLATGRLERVYDACDGIGLEAPNDLAFDSRGRLWFTDLGTLHTTGAGIAGKEVGGIFSCLPDGRPNLREIAGEYAITNLAFGGEDMRDAYVTLSMTGRLVKLRWDEPGLRQAFNA